MNRRLVTGTGLIVALALFLTVNIIANQTLTSLRLDLTENRLYTLSAGSRNILGQLAEPVTLRLYFSAKAFADVPQLLNYGKRVRDMLEEYVATADGKLRLQVIDPEPFSEAEDEAVAYGVRQIPLSGSGDQGYLGVVGTNATDDVQALPLLSPEREDALEYEVTKMIYALAHPKKRVLGIISTLPVLALPPDPMTGQPRSQDWTSFALLKELYDLKEMSPDTKTIEDDIDTLLVVHPKDLPPDTLYAIDQFVLKGGKALIFVDPLAEQDPAQPNPETPGVAPRLDSNLAPLFEKWGIKLVADQVVGDPVAAVRVNFRSPRGQQEVSYLPWLQMQGDTLNHEDFITNELNSVNVGSAGALEALPDAKTKVTPLIQTATTGGFIERDSIIFVRDPAGLLENFKSDGKRHVIAMRVSGEVESAFPEGRPQAEAGKQVAPDPAYLARSKQAINVIVVADTDLLADRFWVRFSSFGDMRIPEPFGNNGDFLVNAVDNLGGNDDLISLRSRGQYTRPFEVVQSIQREAEAQFRDRQRALQGQLAELEKKLTSLQGEHDGKDMLLTPEQKTELEGFRQEQLRTRKELRAVQHELDANIEGLGSLVKFVNTALVPLLIALFAILVAVLKPGARRATS